MKFFFSCLACLIVLSAVFSLKNGVGSAILTGKSATWRIILKAQMEDCRTLESAKLSIDEVRLSFTNEENGYL